MAAKLKGIAQGEGVDLAGDPFGATEPRIVIKNVLQDVGFEMAKAIGRRGPCADDLATLALVYGLTGSRCVAYVLSIVILRAAGVHVDTAQRPSPHALGEYVVRLPKGSRE
jgi:hypothetical protein